jgi:site-specific DNA recombinase
MRVLGRVRLSRVSEESTSPERQREVIQNWASLNDHTVIGWAEDLDVSGSVDPFDTPALGPWLTNPQKLDEWDILCSWKLDRISRRAIPMNKVFGYVMDHDKTLVCVAENLDLGTWMGRMIANVIAGVAEGELEAIRERTKASHQKLRELGRWPGGKPAYGYRAQEREDAAGWELVLDEHAATVMASVVSMVLDGASVESIAATLTEEGELSPADYIRQRSGEPIRGGPWRGQTLRALLRSKTLLGHVTHNGVTVRDADGIPVHKGPAMIKPEVFDQLQAVLDSRTKQKLTNRSSKTSPLLGVAVCYECGNPLHFRGQRANNKTYRYYYCRGGKHGSQIPADQVEELVEQTFLEELGTENVRLKVFIPAENHQIELEEAVRAVEEITPLLGTMASVTMRSRLTEQLSALDRTIQRLESLPTSESRWEYRETAETYQEAWDQADTEGRRQLLLRSGITMAISKIGAFRFELRVPEDVRERLST